MFLFHDIELRLIKLTVYSELSSFLQCIASDQTSNNSVEISIASVKIGNAGWGVKIEKNWCINQMICIIKDNYEY